MRKIAILTCLALAGLTGCELFEKAKAAAEVTFGAGQGIQAVKFNLTVDIPTDFKCGAPIPAKDYTVETKVDGKNCAFTFRREVEVMGKDAYAGPQASTLGAVKSVRRLEIAVQKLAVLNGVTNAALDLNTAIADLSAKVFQQEVINKATVTTLPATKALSGEPLDKVKALVLAKSPVVLPVDVFVALPLDPKPPEKLTVQFEGQPAFVVGL